MAYANRTATLAQNVVTEIAIAATNSAPTYTAATQAKKIAKNPPAAAKDTRSDMTTAFMVAARKKSRKTSSPVSATEDNLMLNLALTETIVLPILTEARRTYPPPFSFSM
ncbi:hypothetical protein Ahy_B03g062944 [Arachis hypogaea]|uniref:Uncharacterized protein n=1 Tax=Arachis hypogaea TaxID=3818 RepID=A0A444ZVW8_ARAHY|nr:hypothetical protein Ahy_B03g062944 [Arachis hypogaea]